MEDGILDIAQQELAQIQIDITRMEDGKFGDYGLEEVSSLRLRLHAVLEILKRELPESGDLPF